MFRGKYRESCISSAHPPVGICHMRFLAAFSLPMYVFLFLNQATASCRDYALLPSNTGCVLRTRTFSSKHTTVFKTPDVRSQLSALT